MVPFFLTSKYAMRLTITTLVDITKTNARRTDNDFAYKQQSNFNTLIQTASLRANIIPTNIDFETVNINQLDFGKEYKGKQKIWKISFENEYNFSLTLDTLQKDFNYVPVVDKLNETVKFPEAVFFTQDPLWCNIIFAIEE